VSAAWCDETDDGVKRGTLSYVEIRDLGDRVIARLSSQRGAADEPIGELKKLVRYVPRERLARELERRGFPRAGAAPGAAAERCVARAVRGGRTAMDGFPATRVSLAVMQGQRELLRRRLGAAAAQRRAELEVRSHLLVEERALAVWIRLPACEGPPPGYFGPKDRGTCHKLDKVRVQLLAARKHPQLASCFAAR
jgi:hypothetical protein